MLIVDPLDSGVGAQIESYAKSHGVAVIDYDRLTLGGSRAYYVSFNNVQVGTLLGQGLVSCVAAWGVANPNVIVMRGAATDNNATLFAQGYDAVMAPYFSSGKWTEVAQPAGTWTPATALTEFQQAYTAHPSANAALIPNDENGAPIISYLQTLHIPAKHFPDHRPGRHPGRPAERAVGLPVRHRLQAHLRRSPGRRGAGHVPPSRPDPAGGPGQRDHHGHPEPHSGAIGPAEPGVGHADQHERHGHR